MRYVWLNDEVRHLRERDVLRCVSPGRPRVVCAPFGAGTAIVSTALVSSSRDALQLSSLRRGHRTRAHIRSPRPSHTPSHSISTNAETGRLGVGMHVAFDRNGVRALGGPELGSGPGRAGGGVSRRTAPRGLDPAAVRAGVQRSAGGGGEYQR